MSRYKRKKGKKRRLSSIEQASRREEILRPHAHLGYDHYVLALHMIQREAFSTAESELRRAIWLNPFEQQFTRQLAWCLYRRGQYIEAREWVVKALEQDPGDVTANDILRLVDTELKGKT